MSAQSPAQAFRRQRQHDEAGARSIIALLNCYCREVASPAGELQLDNPFGQRAWPLALKHAQRAQGARVLQIELSRSGYRILVAVARPSPTLNFDYRSQPFGGGFGKPWQPLDWQALARLLLSELAARYRQSFNDELLAQIGNSVALMGEFIVGTPTAMDWGQGEAAYLRSEQALSFGHAFHPTPKSREGIDLASIRRYSPELGASFQLHFFAVRREDLLQQSHLEVEGMELLRRQLPALALPPGYQALPVHPWQAGHIRALAPVQAALASGRLLDLGPAGEDWYPTASVRTLYQPGRDGFLKCSLHVRLTNCVRKNAWYELESAVGLSGLLARQCRALTETFPSLTLMPEPAFVSVDFRDQPQAQRIELQEAFGLILRQKPCWGADETPLLAGALFGDSPAGEAPVQRLVAHLAAARGLGYRDAALLWFDAYVEQLVHPVLYALCRLGVVFEPHLQNVVVGLREDLPTRLYLRDLEGTKLVPELWPAERLTELSPRARDSVWYDAEKSWQRVGYCLLINNLAQAVFHLARQDGDLERSLWRRLAASLELYQRRHGNGRSAGLIAQVLGGEPWPNKTNLLNRVLKRADRGSEYVPLPSPFPNP
ncbi:iron transporter [Marinobacterium nitratireducens]|uniref:Iron transporter n=1 Tax=Marinobacterium nitratireducens TaxID=518897 RepID=A0A917ZJP4_9GAMM|nr:IucA/IucC family protein [Marinobacterium nitratireducens]GGO84112.1 iron transporter [Marinobacterium nitratireducens]